MSRLIARILLSMLIFPVAAVAYIVAFVVFESAMDIPNDTAFLFAGVIVWAFMALYWWLLWRKSVRWTADRIWLTFAATLLAGIAGAAVGALVRAIMDPDFSDEFGCFAGSAAAPLFWLWGTVFIWRESAKERAARVISEGGREALVCPTCGYNLTGLKEARCPECGSQFTLDQLLASQPSRVNAELEK